MGTRWHGATHPGRRAVDGHVLVGVVIVALAFVTVVGNPLDVLRPAAELETARDRAEELVGLGWTLLLPRELPPGDWRMLVGATGGTPEGLARHVRFEDGFQEPGSASICIVEPRAGGATPSDAAVEDVCGGPGRVVLHERRGALAVVIRVEGVADDDAWSAVALTGDIDGLDWLDRVPSPS